jgi:hypothetical protein
MFATAGAHERQTAKGFSDMKAKDVVGKRIVAIRQTRFFDKQCGTPAVELNAIELEGGALIILHAAESEFEPYVTAAVRKTKK